MSIHKIVKYKAPKESYSSLDEFHSDLRSTFGTDVSSLLDDYKSTGEFIGVQATLSETDTNYIIEYDQEWSNENAYNEYVNTAKVQDERDALDSKFIIERL